MTTSTETPKSLRLFISYGHDEHASLAMRLRDDLRERGHEVWFDEERLLEGYDWEAFIEKGLEHLAADKANAAVILLLTPHSVRRPDGYCLNEVARALALGLRIVPLMVVESELPLSIFRIQWLDMRECLPIHEKETLYRPRYERLLKALEENQLDFEGVQNLLLKVLQPIPFSADILKLLKDFTGREWVFKEVDAWLERPEASKIFWITGAPGVGKSAIAAWVRENRREIAAFHFCDISSEEKRDPSRMVRSIVYQLSTQLPEYQERLARLDLEGIVREYHEAYTLFDKLLIQPLADSFPQPDRTIVVLIDALDEATWQRRNEIVEFLSKNADKTPSWLRFLVTSRPNEPEIQPSLKRLKPYVLDTGCADNRRDLRLFLESRLPHITEAQVQAILERSEGVFLYVRHVVDAIGNKDLSLDRLDEFPHGLGDIYHMFFHRQFGADLPYYEDAITPLLQAVLVAFEPLELGFLKRLCGIESETDFQRCLKRLGSLFPVSGEGGSATIRPFHRSLCEWLTDSDAAGHYFIAASDGHKALAAFCLAEYRQGADRMSRYALRFLPGHLIAAKRWDELIGDETTPGPLTDLLFIQAKCEAGLVHDLVKDYNAALAALPEFREENERLAKRDAAMIAYSKALREYAVVRCDWWLARERGVPQPEPPYPQKPGILEEDGGKRAIPEESFLRAARLRQFACFVSNHLAPLAAHPQDVLPLAYNWAEAGPVAIKSMQRIFQFTLPWLRRSPRPPVPPFRPQCLRTLQGHTGAVTCVTLSADGRRVVSGSHDNTIRIWDAQSGECLQTLQGHTDGVSCVTLSADGCRVVSGSNDKTLRIWDAESGECLQTLQGHTDWVTCVTLSADGCCVISGCYDDTLRIWDAQSGECLRTLQGREWVTCVTLSADGCRVFSGSSDKTLRIWDAESGECLRTLQGHTDAVTCVTLSADGRRVVSGSHDKAIRIWDAQSGECLQTLQGHTDAVTCVTLSADDCRVVSGSNDKTLRIWDAENGECLQTLQGHTDWVTCVTLSADGRRLVSGDLDKRIRIWDAQSGECLRTLQGHTDGVSCVTLSADGRRLVSGSVDKTIRIWDAQSGECLQTLKGHSCLVSCVTLSLDGCRVISGSYDDTLRIWDAQSGECLRTLKGHSNRVTGPFLDAKIGSSAVRGVTLSADGRRVVSGSDDKTIRIWDAQSGECLRMLQGHTDAVTCVTLSADGRRVVSGSHDKAIRIWDAQSGECLQTLQGHTDGVSCVTLSADGRRVVSGSIDKTIRIWDAQSGECLQTLQGHTAWVTGVTLSADGCRVFSGSCDETLRIWDAQNGECLQTLQGHTGAVIGVTLSADGRQVVSGSWDETLRIWDVESGKCLEVYHAGAIVVCPIFSPFGNHIVCGTGDGQMHFLTPVNFPPSGPPIITAVRLWLFGDNGAPGRWDEHLTALCPWCGRRFPVGDGMLGQQIACPLASCGKPLQMNPFVVDGRKEEG